MSLRRGGGKGSFAAADGSNPSSKAEVIEGCASGSRNGLNSDQVSLEMAGVMNDAADDGGWEVCAKKNRNKGSAGVGKTGGPSNAPTRVWGQQEKTKSAVNVAGHKVSGNGRGQGSDIRKQGGKGNSTSSAQSWESTYMAPTGPPPNIAPPLQHGWQWAARSGLSSQAKTSEHVPLRGSVGGDDSESEAALQQPDDCSDDDAELIEDSDLDFSDDYDSDVSQKSHGTRKNSSWFRAFFEAVDKLTNEQLNESTRQWHCPACNDGPGAIDWYRGLQPLITHAKTKGSTRVKLHRDFAELLEEELERRGTSAIASGEVFGKWKGLHETSDHEIVWPPMVVVMNTLLDKDDNEMWRGMGNQELLEYFSDYAAQRARHSYGPRGHRGMSVLIFEASAVGYVEAERLHKHFAEQGTDRQAWDRRNKVLFSPGGQRQLYGFLACKEDMDIFNQHCQAKARLKFEMKSYQEKVMNEMRQMSEDNQQLTWLKNHVAKQELHKKTLEESFGVVSQKLHETMEENRIVRERTTEQYKENKLEMDYQEKFFKEQIAKVHKATEEKEKEFERLLQEERAKAKRSNETSESKEDHIFRQEEIAKFIDSQVKGVEEFETAREELMREHEVRKADMRRRHLEEEVKLEKEFDFALTKLMEKHAPSSFEASSSS